jgi:hypothetical protein
MLSTGIVKNRSLRASCSAAASLRCGVRKDEGFSLSDERKLDPLQDYRVCFHNCRCALCAP